MVTYEVKYEHQYVVTAIYSQHVTAQVYGEALMVWKSDLFNPSCASELKEGDYLYVVEGIRINELGQRMRFKSTHTQPGIGHLRDFDRNSPSEVIMAV